MASLFQSTKKLFSLDNPVGVAVTAATFLLVASPGARKAVRSAMVKGLSMAIAAGETVREASRGVKDDLMGIVDEAKSTSSTIQTGSESVIATSMKSGQHVVHGASTAVDGTASVIGGAVAVGKGIAEVQQGTSEFRDTARKLASDAAEKTTTAVVNFAEHVRNVGARMKDEFGDIVGEAIDKVPVIEDTKALQETVVLQDGDTVQDE